MYETMASEYAVARPMYLLKIHPHTRSSPAGVLPYGGHVHVFRPGTSGSPSFKPRANALKREDVYWPMILAYVLEGKIDTQVVDQTELWDRTLDFTTVREGEVRARERARQEAQAAGQQRLVFGPEGVPLASPLSEEPHARL